MKLSNGIHVTTKMNGKMKGFWSLSTASLMNSFCKAMSKCDDTVCSHCYANAMAQRYDNLNLALISNYNLLTTEEITVNDWLWLFDGKMDTEVFRIESFGDLQNVRQAMNYINLVVAFPNVKFGWWTKHPHLIEMAFELLGMSKPENLQLILSSVKVNEIDEVRFEKYGELFDKVFTVYDKAHAKNICINCGSRDCGGCMACYTSNSTRYISEKIK